MNTIHPVDAIAGAPLYSGRMLRQAASVAFAGATSARPFGVTSGVRPGTSPLTVFASSTNWVVNPHGGVLDFEAAMESGPTLYAIDVAVGGSMRAADAFARIDLIWVRQDIPIEDGSAAPAAVCGYTYGTAPATAPATPARCLVLAQVNVPASGGGSPTVTWKAPYLTAAGVPFATAAGTGTLTGTGGGNTGGTYWDAGVTVTFPAGRFTLPPIVTASGLALGGISWPLVSNVTATGCTVTGVRLTAAPAGTFSWSAVQMTSASSAG